MKPTSTEDTKMIFLLLIVQHNHSVHVGGESTIKQNIIAQSPRSRIPVGSSEQTNTIMSIHIHSNILTFTEAQIGRHGERNSSTDLSRRGKNWNPKTIRRTTTLEHTHSGVIRAKLAHRNSFLRTFRNHHSIDFLNLIFDFSLPFVLSRIVRIKSVMTSTLRVNKRFFALSERVNS